MEAIKNLRESSVLLSNLSFDNYYQLACKIYAYSYVADADDMIGCPSEYMGTVKAIVLSCAEVRDKALYDTIVEYATEDDYRAIYAALISVDIENFEIDQEIEMSYAYSPEEEMDDHIAFCAGLDPNPVRPQDPHDLPF